VRGKRQPDSDERLINRRFRRREYDGRLELAGVDLGNRELWVGLPDIGASRVSTGARQARE
jgi:hypothetical protein